MITIVIPCCNSNLGYLNLALESIFKQTSNNWKIELVDGNVQPNPQLKQLIQELKLINVRYVRNSSNLTMAGNWNFAFQAAETDLVTLLHDDDLLEPTYVERMLKLADSNPESAAFYTDVNLINSEGLPTKTIADSVKNVIRPTNAIGVTHLKGDKGLSVLLKGCFIFCPTMCYRKSKLPEKPFNHSWKMVTDFQFYFDTLYCGKTITGINEKLYNYRRHDKNQTAKLTKDFTRFEEEIDFYNNVAGKLTSEWPLSKREAKRKTIIKLHLMFLMLKSICTLDWRYCIRLVKFFINKL